MVSLSDGTQLRLADGQEFGAYLSVFTKIYCSLL